MLAEIALLLVIGGVLIAAAAGRIRRDAEANESLDRCLGKLDDAFEVQRLRTLLRRYDRCTCGLLRHEHESGLAGWCGRCSGFALGEPADNLETVVTPEDAEPYVISDKFAQAPCLR